MSSLAPLTAVSAVNTHRHSHRRHSSRHCYTTNSRSHSLSPPHPSPPNDTSVFHREHVSSSFNVQDGGDPASPLPPPLPQRHHHQLIIQPLDHTEQQQRDSNCYYSDDSGSTRLPVFPEEDYSEDDNNIRLQQHYPSTKPITTKGKHQLRQTTTAAATTNPALGLAAYQHRPPVVATAVVHPSRGYSVATAPSPLRQHNVLTLTSSSSISPGGLSGGGYVLGGAIAARGRGCGGRCETCENVCYYLLQVAFAMGILIGSSLCIAGAALRRSPGRQLQVLLYIGALVALVSAVLLIVQCRARRQANLRYYQQRPVQTTLHVVSAPQQQQPLSEDGSAQRQSMYHKMLPAHHHHHVVTTVQRCGVPVTLLRQQAYNQAQVTGAVVDRRILL